MKDVSRIDYGAAIHALSGFIEHEMADKGLPALSVALVDDQELVWAQGFGFADPERKLPASADTVYRVGSVSKLFTDIAVMQLVEQRKLDLDAPVTRYLPELQPTNPFGVPITLRQLMAHRSGLVREAPLGSYFDPVNRPLSELVASLNTTTLVHAPGTALKYSNAGVATVGYVLQRVQQEPFAKALQRCVLSPLGMQQSGFELTQAMESRLAKALMWTVFGRTFAAPTGLRTSAPSGSLYSTVNDTARFLSALFAGGGGLLQAQTLAQMWTPQYAAPGERAGYAIGFAWGELDGQRTVGHGGAIYGFASTLLALPDAKLGVIVVSAMDSSNAVTRRIAELGLRSMLALRAGQALPKLEVTTLLPVAHARTLTGRYAGVDRTVDVTLGRGHLSLCPTQAGTKVTLRMLGDALISDGRNAYGDKVKIADGVLTIDDETFRRVEVVKPKPPAERFRGLIGEYGWGHNVLYIFEREGRLWVLIEWFEFSMLEEVSENVFNFPQRGLFPSEQLVFTRAAGGRATEVIAGGVVFKRRNVGPEEGETQLRIEPVRPVAELIEEALQAQPPRENREFHVSELVDLERLDSSIKLEIRYATEDNLLGTVFYKTPRAFLQRAAAESLARAHRRVKERGYGLLIHDGYRPWYVTKVFWDAVPVDKHDFVADPAKGSRHNRGAAVDLTLYDLKTGETVEMVGTFDETSDRSYADYPGGTSLQRFHRDLLRSAMEAEGYLVHPYEWWHFDYVGWEKYPIENRTFEAISP